ncbi:hypothetical protein K450DRAFT_280124 [Umbelopsis ramanniana AG]|uniref:RRM domain-containing protein n=1 Tax=Umbelopsis ramanniana AG TaxID=1314678 RepID=A0AAD5EBZ0_UMBRA|nr:uncharacterized protein K450DRAFT_280124 [Umbelopsis ramanniana AG]KAI8580130.1 hypothetical protein K450DRAFT_280124 [Umbelopsis ramanniana AG]
MAIDFTPFVQETSIHPLSPSAYDTSAIAGSTNGTSENMSSSCRSNSSILFSSNNSSSSNLLAEEISTLCILDIPEDMREREFKSIFCFCPGYEAAMLWTRSGKDMEDDSWMTLIPTPKQSSNTQIGFVKLYTRLDALEAKEVLSGKQWDHLGQKCILKVEMAKRNLQVKRNFNGESTLILTSNPPPAIPRKSSFQAAFDAFHSISPSMTDGIHFNDASYDLFSSSPSTPTLATVENSSFIANRSGSVDTRNDVGGLVSSRLSKGLNLRLSRSMADADDELARQLSNLKTSLQPNNERGFNNALFGSDDLTLSSRFLSMNNVASPLPSPGLAATSYRSYSSGNLTDQNPPCNTLYVGNLPPNTKEDELRQIFSRCMGYKRLCFRSKANGPLCFVEFDDVVRATQAMSELNGYILSNSLKGGIRLSFSKNPLFTKPVSNSPTALLPGFSAIGCNGLFGNSIFGSSDKRDTYFLDSQLS